VELGACETPLSNSHAAKVYLDVVGYKGYHEEDGSGEMLRFVSPELLLSKTFVILYLLTQH
jgi:hypothetical protein